MSEQAYPHPNWVEQRFDNAINEVNSLTTILWEKLDKLKNIHSSQSGKLFIACHELTTLTAETRKQRLNIYQESLYGEMQLRAKVREADEMYAAFVREFRNYLVELGFPYENLVNKLPIVDELTPDSETEAPDLNP